jgi:hypothetical protein
MFGKHICICMTMAVFVYGQTLFAQTCNTIDAITSSTKDMSVVAVSQACETTASIKWTEKHGDGSGYCEYGTSTNYGIKVDISGGSGTVSITGLTASTKYYYHFYMSKGSDICNRLLGSFTTTAGAVVVQPPTITSAAAVSCTTSTTKTYTATATDPANMVVTFTFSGQPSWITSSGAVLTLKPVIGSQNTTVTIIASNDAASDTQNLAVTVVPATGVLNRATTEKQFIINIGSTPIYIPFHNEKTITVSLFSLDGSLVLKKVVTVKNAKNSSVSFNTHLSGTYMCKITSRSGEISQRIVLQK